MGGYNFTDRSRRALQCAGDEAAALHHDYISPEHILLALLRDPDSAAVAVLTAVGCGFDGIPTKVGEIVKPGASTAPSGVRPFTSRVMKVLEFAAIAARDSGTTSVGTQHLLVGLLREEKSIAAQVLINSGVTLGPVTTALQGVRLD
jgi:ATP-dependent Clp protease ATP-binding subunit ClpC